MKYKLGDNFEKNPNAPHSNYITNSKYKITDTMKNPFISSLFYYMLMSPDHHIIYLNEEEVDKFLTKVDKPLDAAFKKMENNNCNHFWIEEYYFSKNKYETCKYCKLPKEKYSGIKN